MEAQSYDFILDERAAGRLCDWCHDTTGSIMDYGSQFLHFIRTKEFVNDLEDSMNDED